MKYSIVPDNENRFKLAGNSFPSCFFYLIENKKAVHDIAFSANHYRFVCNHPLRESNPQLVLRKALLLLTDIIFRLPSLASGNDKQYSIDQTSIITIQCYCRFVYGVSTKEIYLLLSDIATLSILRMLLQPPDQYADKRNFIIIH